MAGGSGRKDAMDKAGVARSVMRGAGAGAADRVELTYEGRLLRRRLLRTAAGAEVLVDLAETTGLADGDALVLDDGKRIAVVAAGEDLVAVTGGNLARLAWHIGNRHTPCQIEGERLVIARDHVLEAMLRQLGADLQPLRAPFRPEGGAYGHGRTMGHDHGPAHGHDHPHDHGHDHDHAHSHGRGVHHHGSHAGGGDAGDDDPA
jgi:urease accessory protein